MKDIIKAELMNYMSLFVEEQGLDKSAFGDFDAEYLSNQIMKALEANARMV